MRRDATADPRRIHEWTTSYEEWLATEVPFVVAADIERKHDAMAESPFVFLRATYYAWAKHWPAAAADLAQAPEVTAVGDLHLENFGTWRDAEGRLAWGINAFDEASVLPYTNDLVRLATSVVLAYDDERIRTPADELSGVFLEAYRQCLEAGGQEVVFGEEHHRLQEHILSDLIQRRGKRKRKQSKGHKAVRLRNGARPPADCEDALLRALPAGVIKVEMRPRTAGVGSLGRPRFVAAASWHGGPLMREAKARASSAALWATGQEGADKTDAFDHLLRSSIRSPDPFLHFSGGWIIRRLAADTDKIEINVKSLPRSLETELAMLIGREVANVHLATPGASAAILADLRARKRDWLLKAAREMAAVTEESCKAWRKAWNRTRSWAR